MRQSKPENPKQPSAKLLRTRNRREKIARAEFLQIRSDHLERRKGSSRTLRSLSMLCGLPSFPPFAAVVAVSLFLLPSFGSSLSQSPSRHDVPFDPCLELAKGTGANKGGANAATTAKGISCPSYHPSVLDGRVCLGCFRDDYEIANWESFSPMERSYALEDASDRATRALEGNDNGNEPFREGGSLSADELKRQAGVWRALAAEDGNSLTNPGTSLREGSASHKSSETQDASTNAFAAAGYTPSRTIPIASSVSVSTGTSGVSATTNVPNAETLGKVESDNRDFTTKQKHTELSKQPTEDEQPRRQQQQQQQQPPPPPTPCTRICRYNANCYDGKVCIGCFRDTHDIAQWSSMSPFEKMFSLEDAADRCRDLSEIGRDTDSCFEGGISEAALRDQAKLWGAWNQPP